MEFHSLNILEFILTIMKRLLLALLSVLCPIDSPAEDEDRPNILIYYIDDLGWSFRY